MPLLRAGSTVNLRYKILGLISEGGMGVVYKGEDLQKKQPVAIKFLKQSVATSYSEAALRFKNEIRAISTFEHDNIVRLLDSGEHETLPYLVMEYVEGESLSDIIKNKKEIPLDFSIGVVRQAGEALSYVHTHGILHRDLKPGNILIKEFSGQKITKLLDFGLALLATPSETNNNDDVTGAYAYMSPEIAGVINKKVDERSDLYSLGVILYQLLTGQLPFKGSTAEKMIHQQIAFTPERPGILRHGIPPVIEEITMKLLMKDPGLRYQSAKGLVYDLYKIQRGEKNIIIGERDQKIKLTYRTELIGRDDVMENMAHLVGKAMASQGTVMLVSGEAGQGKSRIVEEVSKNVTSSVAGLFLRGHCINQENKIPYQPLRDALNDYVRHLESLDENIRNKELKAIQAMSGESIEIITQLCPQLSKYLGEPKNDFTTDTTRENQLFLAAASDFLFRISSENRPCIIYLDDLQWSDNATIALLEYMASKIKEYPLLILGTYRTSDVTGTHPLQLLKDEARDKGYPLRDMRLQPLGQAHMRKLVACLLGANESSFSELSAFIREKSGGNPLFAINMLRNLVEEKALLWKDGAWEENWDRIRRMSVTNNVADVLLKRTGELNSEETELLSVAAVIGREFDTVVMHRVTGRPKEEIGRIIADTIALQIVEEGREKGTFRFTHESIRNAFLEKLDAPEKKRLHLAIASAIEELNKDSIYPVIYDIAYHYTESGNNQKALQYAIPAAKKARNSHANEEAAWYFKVAIGILEAEGKQSQQEWLRLKEELADVYLVSGSSDKAIEICEDIMEFEENDLLARVALYKKLGIAYFKKGNMELAEQYFCDALSLLGHKLPRKKLQLLDHIATNLLLHMRNLIALRLFKITPPEKLGATDNEIARIYLHLVRIYAMSDGVKFSERALRLLTMMEMRTRKSKELGQAFAEYGLMLCSLTLFKAGNRYLEKGVRVAGELFDEWGMARALVFRGYYYHWKGEYDNAINTLDKAKDIFKRMGDMWETGSILLNLGIACFHKGELNFAMDYFSQSYDISSRIKDDCGISASQSWLALTCKEKGEFARADEWSKKSIQLSRDRRIFFNYCIALAYAGSLHLAQGRYDDAVQSLELARKKEKERRYMKDYVTFLYPELLDARIERYRNGMLSSETRAAELKKIRSAAREALYHTIKWVNQYAVTLRVLGKYYAITGKRNRAEHSFLKSIELMKNGNRQVELGKSYFEYALFLESIKETERAQTHLRKAYGIFFNAGAEFYTTRIGRLLGIAAGDHAGNCASKDTPTPVQSTRLKLERRLNAAVEISRYLSSLLNIDGLLDKLLESAMELVGAERGMLFLKENNKLELKGSKNIGGGGFDQEKYAISRGIISRVEETGEPVVLDDAGKDPESGANESAALSRLKSVICAPIVVRDEMIGILYLDNRLVSGLFTSDDLKVLDMITRQAGISIENARLYSKAVTDGLTDLYNRIFFESHLTECLNTSQRYNSRMALMMIDIDHFKKINDTLGHQAGDAVLKLIAKTLRAGVRKSDVVARFGGEEFAVILHETTIDMARSVAEKLREMVAAKEIAYNNGTSIPVTISIGITEALKTDTITTLIERADKGLYQAKHLGRNRVEESK